MRNACGYVSAFKLRTGGLHFTRALALNTYNGTIGLVDITTLIARHPTAHQAPVQHPSGTWRVIR
jgi:hypothetical protein